MKENKFFDQPKDKPTLEELDSVSGREIAGIPSRWENFVRLEDGADYGALKENKNVVCDRSIKDFFLFLSPSIGTVKGLIEAPHWRSLTTEGVHAHIDLRGDDPRQDFFYVANTKGCGYLKIPAKGLPFDDYDSWMVKYKDRLFTDIHRDLKMLGLAAKDEVLWDTMMAKSELLLAQGLRTELYWGMAEIQRLPYKGEMTDLKTLKKKKVVSPRKDYEPTQAVRLFKINTRIAEVAEADDRRNELFRKAFEVFNQETRDKGLALPEIAVGNAEQEKIFFEEFFRRMGKNLAVMLNSGYDHGAIHSANVTLAAEIVDIETIHTWREAKDKEKVKKYNGVHRASLKDMRDVCYDLRMLINAAQKANLHFGTRGELEEVFFEEFDRVFDSEKVALEDTDPVGAREWLRKIFSRLIIQRGNLPSLLHNEVEDWDISV